MEIKVRLLSICLIFAGLLWNGCGYDQEKRLIKNASNAEYGIYDVADGCSIKTAFKAIINFRYAEDFQKIVFSEKGVNELYSQKRDLFLTNGSTLLLMYDRHSNEYWVKVYTAEDEDGGVLINSYPYAGLNNDDIRDYVGKRVRIITPKLVE